MLDTYGSTASVIAAVIVLSDPIGSGNTFCEIGYWLEDRYLSLKNIKGYVVRNRGHRIQKCSEAEASAQELYIVLERTIRL